MTATLRRAAVLAALSPLILTVPSAAMADTPGTLKLSNLETVEARLDASGTVVTAELVDLLTATGSGTETVHNPAATADLRNLDGYRKPGSSGDDLVQTVSDGSRISTRATVEKALPVTLHVQYQLDGRTVAPAEVRGKSGTLTITYTVTNRSFKDTTITYADAAGEQHSVTEKVFTPLAGELVADLPAGYRNVAVSGGTLSGTGTGGSHVAYNLVLAPPMGTPTTSVTLRADVTNAQIPAARMQLVPAATSTDPATAFGAKTFDSSSTANTKLAEGVTGVDDQVVALQSGVSSLADGLTQLSAGAGTLQQQLNGKLAPGAKQTADGAAKTSDGAKQLAAGTDQIAGAATSAADGVQSISTGLARMDQGLTKLSGIDGLPASLAGIQALDSAVRQIVTQLGSPTEKDSVLGAMTRLADGSAKIQSQLDSAHSATSTIADGLQTTAGKAGPLSAASSSSAALVTQVLDANCGAQPTLTDADCTALRKAEQQSSATADGLTTLGDALTKASDALATVSSGLGKTEQAAADLTHGLAATTSGLEKIRSALAGSGTGASARKGVLQGLDALVAGLTQQVHGVTGLANATSQAAGAAGQLSAGTSQLAAGAATAAGSADQVAAGADKVAQGSQQVAAGAQAGADAAGQIAAGTATSADGATKAATGAGQLHEKGTTPLADSVAKGSATTAQVSALFQALDASAADALPYGAPKGATGSAMWNFRIDPAPDADPAGAPAHSLGDGGLIAIALALLFGSVTVAGLVRRWPRRG